MPAWVDEQYKYLGKTTRILREHTTNFTLGVITPLLETTCDSIWVNEWSGEEKKYIPFIVSSRKDTREIYSK